MSYVTTFRGRRVDTVLRELNDNVDTVCVNDDCPGLEVLVSYRDEDTGELVPEQVSRVAFDCGYVGATRLEPGYPERDWCPTCGRNELEAL